MCVGTEQGVICVIHEWQEMMSVLNCSQVYVNQREQHVLKLEAPRRLRLILMQLLIPRFFFYLHLKAVFKC